MQKLLAGIALGSWLLWSHYAVYHAGFMNGFRDRPAAKPCHCKQERVFLDEGNLIEATWKDRQRVYTYTCPKGCIHKFRLGGERKCPEHSIAMKLIDLEVNNAPTPADGTNLTKTCTPF